MIKKIKLSIIIVNYNVKDLLKACLGSIDRCVGNFSTEVIVIDNNSSDGSQEMLRAFMPQHYELVLKLSDENLGFARGNNLGLEHATGEYVFFLNPDTLLLDGSLKEMVAYLDKHTELEAIGPRLLNGDDSQQASIRTFPTVWSQLVVMMKLHNIFPHWSVVKKYLQTEFDYSKAQDVEQIMGAALLARKSVIDTLHGFDPGYKRIFEEVDLCKRIHASGHRIGYFPDAKIIHYKGASFHGVEFKPSLKRQHYFNHDMLRYFKKFKPMWQSILLRVVLPINYVLTLGTILATALLPEIKDLKNKDF